MMGNLLLFLSDGFWLLLGKFTGWVLSGVVFGLGVSSVKFSADLAAYFVKRFLLVVFNVFLMIKILEYLTPILTDFSSQLNNYLSSLEGTGQIGVFLLSMLTRWGLVEGLSVLLTGYVTLFVFRMMMRLVR